MTLVGLAIRNLRGGGYRNGALTVAVVVLAGLSFVSTAILRGADQSLRLGLARLGAELTVLPRGAAAVAADAVVFGQATPAWMPEEQVATVAATAGVGEVSPQLHLSTLTGASCCSAAEMFVIAFDPATDFVIQPWLRRQRRAPLALGEAVGGAKVSVPPGEPGLRLYGTTLRLAGNLEPTGTGLDQTLYLGFDTARAVAAASATQAQRPLELPSGRVSAILVRLAPGAEARTVAKAIERALPTVRALEGSELGRSLRRQLSGLRRAVTAVLGAVWATALLLTGLVFSSAAEQRRRELAVLRALGATRSWVVGVLLVEAALIAGFGAVGGVLLGGLGVQLFSDLVSAALGLPFVLPTVGAVLVLAGAVFAFALALALLAALAPALRASRAEAAAEMRE